MNTRTRLLLRVKQTILRNPRAFDADTDDHDVAGLVVRAARRDPCWRRLQPKLLAVSGELLTAQRLLGITTRKADSLFLPFKWPRRFRRQYRREGSWRLGNRRYERVRGSLRDMGKNAKVAAARIDYFLETGH
ncbi:MAG TPA: hypothetical protein VNK82_05855 [Terriglobales bacterium]|nr:hypothetical protein [Terriglobales bacterium]